MIIERGLSWMARKTMNRYLQVEALPGPAPPLESKEMSRMLYIHIPFCEELCPYCSFYRIPYIEQMAKAYFKALAQEIRIYKEQGVRFDAVYVGGGTPTVLPRELAGLLEEIQGFWPIGEISVETHPRHLSPENLTLLRQAGVNRLSVGVQTFQNEILKKMNRLHKYGSGEEISRRILLSQHIFATLNIDMIFNFPGQSEKMLLKDIQQLRTLKPDQISYYPLMVSTHEKAAILQNWGGISPEREHRYYNLIVQGLADLYDRSSPWCLSRKDGMIDEYIVRYGEYVGAGAGAFSYCDSSIRVNIFSVPQYIKSLNQGRLPLVAARKYEGSQPLRYDFLMGLFSGILNLKRLAAKHHLHTGYRLWKEILFFLLSGGVKYKKGSLHLTEKGNYYILILFREFFTAVNNFRKTCRRMTKNKNPLARNEIPD